MAVIPSILSLPRPKRRVWMPAIIAVLVICAESQNGMGAAQTSTWLSELVHWTGHQDNFVWLINHILRKTGHFMGYGLLGLCFARGWLHVLRRRVATTWVGLRLRAGACGIASAFVIASGDEFHQMFLPTRGASVWDVLLDTSGALTLCLLVFCVMAIRRHVLVMSTKKPFTTLGLSLASIPRRSRAVRRMIRSNVRNHGVGVRQIVG